MGEGFKIRRVSKSKLGMWQCSDKYNSMKFEGENRKSSTAQNIEYERNIIPKQILALVAFQ